MDGRNGIELILIPLDENPDEFDVEVLSKDEIARGSRLIMEEKRLRWIRCRAALRQILATYLEVSPKSIQFEYDRHGKPWLVTSPFATRVPIYFNLSHSEGHALLGIGEGFLVGVDIEIITRRFDAQAIAGQLLTDSELESWKLLADLERPKALLDAWACKEAILKAFGVGILAGTKKVVLPRFPLPKASFTLVHIDRNLERDIDPRTLQIPQFSLHEEAWRLSLLELPSGGSAAVAYPYSCHLHSLRSWREYPKC